MTRSCRLILALFAGLVTLATAMEPPPYYGWNFPSADSREDARMGMATVLAHLQDGRIDTLLANVHSFEVYFPPHGWVSSDRLEAILGGMPVSGVPGVEAYQFFTLPDVAARPGLRRLSRPFHKLLDQKAVLALASDEALGPQFLMRRESPEDPWVIAAMAWPPFSQAEEAAIPPRAWSRHPLDEDSDTLATPPGWTIRPAPAADALRFLPDHPESPPVIRLDFRDFSGPYTEFALNWAGLTLETLQATQCRVRLVEKGLRFDFRLHEGDGVLGLLVRGKRLMLFSMLFPPDSLKRNSTSVDTLFHLWSRSAIVTAGS